MGKLLIAVKSCLGDRDHGCHQTIRDTWGSDVPGDVDLRFFVGGGWRVEDLREADELVLNVEDDYDHLPSKTREILRWSSAAGYSYTFLCDVDTFVIPAKLMGLEYRSYDYSGRFGTVHPIGKTFRFKDGRGIVHPVCHPWASGGIGYFISRKAADIISPIAPDIWAEDMWIAQVLGPEIWDGVILAKDLEHFENETSWHYPAHFMGWDRDKMQRWMRNMYESTK